MKTKGNIFKEINSGEYLSEVRRSTRICDMLERAMKGAPLDAQIYDDEEYEPTSSEELDDWSTHEQYEVDLNDGFEASEYLQQHSRAVGASDIAVQNFVKQAEEVKRNEASETETAEQ